jgi:predicted NAD/FAD-binding protein
MGQIQSDPSRPHIVVVGSGISGLSAAWHLRDDARVTVLESDRRLGGHTHTRLVDLEGRSEPVDTGFIVFNHKTYPEFRPWLDALQVATTPTEMSFSVSVNDGAFEWSGSNLDTVFAQRSNTLRPRFWAMLSEIMRFNRRAPLDCVAMESGRQQPQSLGAYLEEGRYGALFQQAYLLPMAGAIWSCPPETMRAYPFASFVRFCMNHGLLQIMNRPQWFSLSHGSSSYITRLLEVIKKQSLPIAIHPDHAVEQSRLSESAQGRTVLVRGRRGQGQEAFEIQADAVIYACHADQAVRCIDPKRCPTAVQWLSKVRFQPNTAYLHTDTRLMPKRRRAWAAWNYLSQGPVGSSCETAVSVTYWMNRLQSLPFRTPVLVSLNPLQPPAESRTLEVNQYAHPIFDAAAVQAQKQLSDSAGESLHWFAGAWMGYGFHEDGFRSGRLAAASVVKTLGLAPARSQSAEAWAA